MLKNEVPASGLGTKSLYGCERSTSPLAVSLRAAEFWRVICKQMA